MRALFVDAFFARVVFAFRRVEDGTSADVLNDFVAGGVDFEQHVLAAEVDEAVVREQVVEVGEVALC